MQKNKITTYLLYAIGEIVLVVIGILIAVSINNWNEDRKAQISEAVLLANLIEDLRLDAAQYTKNKHNLERIDTLHRTLFSIMIDQSKLPIKDAHLVRRTIYFQPITQENNPNLIGQLRNEVIKRVIAAYFKSVKNLSETFGEFEEVVAVKVRDYLSRQGALDIRAVVEIKNIKNADDLAYIEFVNSERLRLLIDDVYFQQILLESNLKLTELKLAIDDVRSQNKQLIKIIEKELK